MYSRDDELLLRWVLKREISINNSMEFTTRVLVLETTEVHHACNDDEVWRTRTCVAFSGGVGIVLFISTMLTASISLMTTVLLPFTLPASMHIDEVKLLFESGAQKSLYHKSSGRSIPMEGALPRRERYSEAPPKIS